MSSPTPAAPAPQTPRALTRELAIAYALGFLLPVAIFQIGRFVPLVRDNLNALVAAVFLYIPAWLLWRRGDDLSSAGLVVQPLRKSLILIALYLFVVLPLFVIGFAYFYREACAHLPKLTPPGVCRSFRGVGAIWDGIRLPPRFWELVLTEIVVVAIPEELFFRGYLHGQLEKLLPPRRRLWGGGIGWALLLSSLLFALGHLAIEPGPHRLAVFFPGLVFGWMRSATGSILAGSFTHAVSNLLMKVLAVTYFHG